MGEDPEQPELADLDVELHLDQVDVGIDFEVWVAWLVEVVVACLGRVLETDAVVLDALHFLVGALIAVGKVPAERQLVLDVRKGKRHLPWNST